MDVPEKVRLACFITVSHDMIGQIETDLQNVQTETCRLLLQGALDSQRNVLEESIQQYKEKFGNDYVETMELWKKVMNK